METEEWVPHKPDTWPWVLGRVKRDIVGEKYLGHWDANGPVIQPVPLKKGTLVRIVMVSRFGDVGITPDLEDSIGYVARVSLDELRREL